MTATQTQTLASLTRLQRLFVEHLYTLGCKSSEYSRGTLREMAAKGGWKWAPAWIVKDTSRRTARGFYSIPELQELRDGIDAGTESLSWRAKSPTVTDAAETALVDAA